MSTIWAFDLGKASIGEAVWNTEMKRFDHVASLLIPAEFASTKAAAARRRMMRTRQAHKAREAWLEEVWTQAGLTPLHGRKVGKVSGQWQLISAGDEKLEREFPAPGDGTCYTSCLLRIKLLRGERLEEWQIYKALRSAIQKRGYGRVPWAARDVKKKDLTEEELQKELEKQEKDLAKKDPMYRAAIEAWPHYKETHDPRFHYPCYYDADKQKLWNQEAPDVLKFVVDHLAESTRQVRFDREDVEKEIAELARQAAKQIPALASAFAKWQTQGWTVPHRETKKPQTFAVRATDMGAFLVHGPAGEPTDDAKMDFAQFIAFREEAGIHVGSHDDWMGATGQKTPRFDNRIVNDCAVMTGMKVCKVDVRFDSKTGKPWPDSLLPAEVTFLMKLKNTLVQEGYSQRKLSPQELRSLFAQACKKLDAIKPDTKNRSEKATKCFSITQAAWGKEKGIKELSLRPLPGHEEVKPPKFEGRSRYSRPALKLIRALILSGQAPSLFLKRLESREAALLDEIGMDIYDADPTPVVAGQKQKHALARPYLLMSHLKFLRDLAATNDTWEGIYIPEQKMDALEAKHRDEDGQVDAASAIKELIASNNDPIVRHRLEVFASRLAELESVHGAPSEVVLEFVRTDFMGEDAKRDLAKFQKDREKARQEARSVMMENHIDDRSAPLKYELLLQQRDLCLYCGDNISMDQIAEDKVDIDHIVPRSKGGPDAMVNYVLAHRKCNAMNQGKGDQTPFEWLHGKPGWDAYVDRVNKCATTLRNKKVQLLLREDARTLVERYTALAETAWISKLAKKIVSLHFGWKNGVDDSGDLRVTVVSGGLTGRIRRKYKLNGILNPNAESEEEAEKKNRKDHRHHALDAMVISQLPNWMGDKKKEKFFRFEEPIAKNPRGFFASEIERVMPEALAYEQATLADTTYARRWEDAQGKVKVIVQRTPLIDLAMKPNARGEANYDLTYLEKNITTIRELKVKKDGKLVDGPLVMALKDLLNTRPSQHEWEDFCAEYRKPRKDGSNGPRVIQVTVLAGEPTEYREMSKDRTGAWRKGGGNHQGQIIYHHTDGNPKVHPVYVHASIPQEIKKLKDAGYLVQGFFQSGCIVKTMQVVTAAEYSHVIRNEKDEKRRVAATAPLPPCLMTLRNIITKDMVAELTLADNTRIVAKIDVWVKAGITRI